MLFFYKYYGALHLLTTIFSHHKPQRGEALVVKHDKLRAHKVQHTAAFYYYDYHANFTIPFTFQKNP